MLPYCESANKSNKTIYINPNFRGQMPTTSNGRLLRTESVIPKNAHINPLFLEAHKNRHTIHMNPAFLQKFQEYQLLQQQPQEENRDINKVTEKESNTLLEYQGIEMTEKTLRRNNEIKESRKIICISKNRLIREPFIKKDCQAVELSKPFNSQPPLLVLNKRKLVRKAPIVSEIFNKTQSKCVDDSKARITKYKLDNRVLKKKALLPPTPKIKRTSYVGRYALRRNSLSVFTNTIPIQRSLSVHKKLHVLNINGLLYKCSQNSLKLKAIETVRTSSNTISKLSKTSAASQKSPANYNLKTNPGLTIFVRGTKYVMDANKFKLTRVTNSNPNNIMAYNNPTKASTVCRRIDIGGYTYISVNSSKNVLIRTTNHLSRAYVHNAKQKSVQMLTKRLVKTNIPCPIFQRIGKCAAFERGKCSKVHNKLQIAICTKFLRGECLNTSCLLSHNVSLSKMPVCKFFLQGVCVRNDCPYLHKKLSNKTELCIEFLRGYCQLAEKCDKRHEFLCPEIERNNVCTTKNCVYCNAKRRKDLQIEKKVEKFANRDETGTSIVSSSTEVADNPSCKRYFIEPCDNDKTIKDPTESSAQYANEVSDNNVDCVKENVETSQKSRPKLGTLPSYIPL